MEFFNEAMLMVTGYHLFCYTSFVPKASTRYQVGTSLIIWTIFTVVVNLSVLTTTPIRIVRRKVLSIYLPRRYKIDETKLI
jgi:succinate-acetate transporter protein